MQCPYCSSTHICKNGHRRGKQNHICAVCGRQFIDQYQPQGYSNDVKRLCLKMYVNGMGIRGISRVTDIAHTTILEWMKQIGECFPDTYEPKQLPQVGELDELETFVGSKKNKVWIWTAVTIFVLVYLVGSSEIIVLKLLNFSGKRSP